MNTSILNQYNSECKEALDCGANLSKCFEKSKLDWIAFNANLARKILSGDRKAIAIDPSYIPKSGNKTPWIGYFWSGVAGSMKRGRPSIYDGKIDFNELDRSRCERLDIDRGRLTLSRRTRNR